MLLLQPLLLFFFSAGVVPNENALLPRVHSLEEQGFTMQQLHDAGFTPTTVSPSPSHLSTRSNSVSDVPIASIRMRCRRRSERGQLLTLTSAATSRRRSASMKVKKEVGARPSTAVDRSTTYSCRAW